MNINWKMLWSEFKEGVKEGSYELFHPLFLIKRTIQDYLSGRPENINRIVCSACRLHVSDYANPITLVGVRHLDKFMVEQKTRLDLKPEYMEQGFLDKYGNFLSRAEAWRVALFANQIIRRVGGDTRDGGTLYSENLY